MQHRAATLCFVVCLTLAANASAQTVWHFQNKADAPPGVIGQRQLLRGGPLPGYFQPVEVNAPAGTIISAAAEGTYAGPGGEKLLAGMLIGQVYRLKVGNIPGHEGKEVFPTIEVIDRLYPPPGQAARFPVPIMLTQEELEYAIDGRYVLRVIYVEDQQSALPVREIPGQQRYYEIAPNQDALEVADRLGRPVAILRMGSRVPLPDEDDAQFQYQYPPVLLTAPPVVGRTQGLETPLDAPPILGRPSRNFLARAGVKTAMSHAMKNGQSLRFAAVIPLVLLCSCKNLPFRDVVGGASKLPSPSASIRAAAEKEQVTASKPAPAAVAPKVAFDQSVQPVNYVQQVGHRHHAGHPHSGSCPHCGPGTLPSFAFSDMYSEEDGLPWKPPGIKGPWPPDEYICDGGDMNNDVRVKKDWTVVGLDQEDTVAHYDTLDGQTEVTPSNCVCIYAPRFAAVRLVTSPVLQEGHERMADVVKPVRVNIHEEQRGPKTAFQPEQLVAEVGLDQAQAFRERTQGLLVDQPTRLVLAADAFLPREELLFIQRGEYDASEKARLAQRVAAAITWTDNKAVQILIDGKPAVEARGTIKPEETYTYELEGKPRLRLCKIADKSEAQPGEIITFTLRYDNVGEQKIGNVTIIDHLMPRLEYVPDSAQSTLNAAFNAQEQIPGESLVLRWEIQDPLEVNQGGVIRFQARVR